MPPDVVDVNALISRCSQAATSESFVGFLTNESLRALWPHKRAIASRRLGFHFCCRHGQSAWAFLSMCFSGLRIRALNVSCLKISVIPDIETGPDFLPIGSCKSIKAGQQPDGHSTK
jgi:hypothetical protein